MKTWLRILFLTLAMLLLLSCFVGCGEVETPQDTEEEEEDDEYDYFPDIDKQDYDSEFSLYMMSINNFSEFYVLEESNGSPMDEAVYRRQEQVKKYLGVEMVHKTDGNANKGEYISILQNDR